MGNIDLRFYLSIFLRRLPYFLATVFLLSTAAIVVAYMWPSVYRAQAKILVEPPQIPSNLARSTVAESAMEQLHIIQEQLTTRENLLALADRFDIYGPDHGGLSAPEIAEDLRARIGFEHLLPQGAGDGQGVTVFSVSFHSPDPVLAADIVNVLVQSILSKNLRLRADRAEGTTQFFAGEVERLGGELSAVEDKILKFKNDNVDALPDALEFRRNQRNRYVERMQALDIEEEGLRKRRSNLVEMFARTGRVFNEGPITPEQQMLQDLSRALSDQLVIFSEDSPSIVAIRKRIADLQSRILTNQQKGADLASGKREPSALDLQLADIDERLSLIAQERSTITDNLKALDASIAATPANEAALKSLERNRDNLQAQYNAAIARLSDASTGEEIEMRSKGLRLSLVEPATPPERRLKPSRRRIAAMGAAGSIGAGLGLVVLLELLNKTIRRPSEIEQLLQIQPLATIPYIRSGGEDFTRKFKIFSGLSLTVAALGALVAFAHYNHATVADALQMLVRT